MVAVFGARMAVHFSPKDMGPSAGIKRLFSDSPDCIVWPIMR